MKTEKIGLDSRRCCREKRPVGDVGISWILPAWLPHLPTSPRQPRTLQASPSGGSCSSLLLPTVVPSTATLFPCSGPCHVDFPLNRVCLFAPGCLCAQQPAWVVRQASLMLRPAGSHEQLLIWGLKSFPRFYENIYVLSLNNLQRVDELTFLFWRFLDV